jgi:hypothetical protein
MVRKALYAFFSLLVLLLGQARELSAQNLNGEIIQVAADALTVLKFNSEIKRFELGDREAYTCQVRDNDNSIVIKTMRDSCSTTNLIVTEGKRSHYFIIHFLKEIDLNKTKLFYDYSDLKELRRKVNETDMLAVNTKDDNADKEDKKDKKQKKKEREEQEAREKEAQRLADEQKKKEQDAIAANELKEQEAIATAETDKKKKKKGKEEPADQPAEQPVAQAKTSGVNNNTAQPYVEEPVVAANTKEPGNKKAKKEKKGKTKQATPDKQQDTEPVAANYHTAQPDTARVSMGEPVANAQEPVAKKSKKDRKGKTKQTSQDNTKTEEPVLAANNDKRVADTPKMDMGEATASVDKPKTEKTKRTWKSKEQKPVENTNAPQATVADNTKAKEPDRAKTDARQDSITAAKAELQRLIAKDKERQTLAKKYPGINFDEPPNGQMLTGDFFVPTDTTENSVVSTSILRSDSSIRLNISSTNDKGLEVTLQSITFSGVNAYMRLNIKNNGKTEVPIGKMNVQWMKSNGNSYNLYACYVSGFPILAPGKQTTIIYSTRAVNAGSADAFIFTMNDRQDKFTTNLSFGGEVYNREMGWKP